jgi:S-formylglutathione hydrolase FrmB
VCWSNLRNLPLKVFLIIKKRTIAVYYTEGILTERSLKISWKRDIPYVYIPHHKKSNQITISNLNKNTDSGGWSYNVNDTPDFNGRTKGQILINCLHDDWSKL